MKIYTAGPLGFSEAGRAFHRGYVLPEVQRLGHEALDPWTPTDPSRIDAVLTMPYGEARRDAWRVLNAEIGNNNRAAIDACDLVFAVLDGVDVDSGTAAEIGYAKPSRSSATAATSGFQPTTKARSSICRSNTSSAKAAVRSSWRSESWRRRWEGSADNAC